MNNKHFSKQIKDIYKAVNELEKMFPGRPFTPDGHMVGSIGECLVADAYDLELMPPSNKGFDAKTKDGKEIEIKATQSNSVAFRSKPEYAIVIRIHKDGTFSRIYNGVGSLIWDTFKGKKLPSNGQYQISLTKLVELSKMTSSNEQIPLKNKTATTK